MVSARGNHPWELPVCACPLKLQTERDPRPQTPDPGRPQTPDPRSRQSPVPCLALPTHSYTHCPTVPTTMNPGNPYPSSSHTDTHTHASISPLRCGPLRSPPLPPAPLRFPQLPPAPLRSAAVWIHSTPLQSDHRTRQSNITNEPTNPPPLEAFPPARCGCG